MMLMAALLVGCGESSDNQAENSDSQEKEQKLSEFEMEHGIGPVDEKITIGEIDAELAKEGMRIFDMKCSSCHKMEGRYVGPPLGGITEVRTPAYIMNMILNPEEMIEKHPIPKALYEEYLTRMTYQNVSREEARAIVEYLASEDRAE